MVDDDPMVRQLVKQILRPDDIDVVSEAADGDEVVTQVQAHHPDVVLMDLAMRRVDGVTATQAVGRLPNAPGVIAMTSFDTESAILAAVRAGAAGFLAKDSSPEEFVAAVRAVAAGAGALSPRAAKVVMAQVSADPGARARDDARAALRGLTERELEVAQAVGSGMSNAEIAQQVYLSEATVKTHLGRAMAKTGTATRVQLAVVVDRAGLGVR